MDIPEGLPPNRSYWHPNLSNNIIIINYYIMSDIIEYYYLNSFNILHYKLYSNIKKNRYNRRI